MNRLARSAISKNGRVRKEGLSVLAELLEQMVGRMAEAVPLAWRLCQIRAETRYRDDVGAGQGSFVSGLQNRRLRLPRFEPWTCHHQRKDPLTSAYAVRGSSCLVRLYAATGERMRLAVPYPCPGIWRPYDSGSAGRGALRGLVAS